MNILSVIIAGILGLLMVVYITLLFVTIIFNVKIAENYRQGLAEKLDELRLSSMLDVMGININTYLHSESILDIRRQMAQCSDCQNIDACDETIKNHDSDISDDISFCNNEDEIKTILQRKSKEE
ncbi:MAG: DUF6455 family protein [Gammaproteobacteria bacterium]